MKKIINWLKNGNDCSKCNASWEDWGAYHEDCSCGCHIKGSDYDEKICRLIAPIKWLLLRRSQYYMNHEYDGIGEFYAEQEIKQEKCIKAIKEMLDGRVICLKYDDGTLHECNTDFMIEYEAWRVADALKPEWKPPLKLRQRWKRLLIDTIMVLPNKIKPFICK